MPVSRETREKRYADILASKDVQAWLLKQRMANWRYCSVCKGRVVRKRDTIECRKCGRWMTIADYEASIAPAPEPQRFTAPVEDDRPFDDAPVTPVTITSEFGLDIPLEGEPREWSAEVKP